MSSKPKEQTPTKPAASLAVAKSLAADAAAVSGYGFDPLTILAILAGLVQMLAACKKSPADAAADLRRPNRLVRATVRRECRKRVGDRDAAEVLADAVLSHAETATAASVAELMADLKG